MEVSYRLKHLDLLSDRVPNGDHEKTGQAVHFSRNVGHDNISGRLWWHIFYTAKLLMTFAHQSCQPFTWEQGSSVVRVPDLWSKGPGFKSLQNFLLHGQLSVLTLILVSIPPPCYVKDPSHSAKNVGGRLQLNTHAHYVCGFAWSDMVYGCMVYTECT